MTDWGAAIKFDRQCGGTKSSTGSAGVWRLSLTDSTAETDLKRDNVDDSRMVLFVLD